MPRPKGQPNNSSIALALYLDGRKIYAPEKVINILEDHTPQQQGGITGGERLKGWLTVMEYLYSKRKATDPDENGNDKAIEHKITFNDDLERAVVETMKLNALPK